MHFYFQLTEEECLRFQFETAKSEGDEKIENLKFQTETSSLRNWSDEPNLKSSTSKWGGVRKKPYVFTEQGVAMLATVLRTPAAASVSINVMRAFVAIRKYISVDLIEQKFVILDDEAVYHCGASVNRVGYKTFSITEIYDENIRKILIGKIKAIFA